MSSDLSFRTDLYRGTAPYYDRFRPPYPDALFADLLGRVAAQGRLLDLACGTGQVAMPLAAHFAGVWAVDQEEESVAFARAKATELGIVNVDWVVGAAEEVVLDGPFDLVTVGTAFHRLPRQAVAARMFAWLRPGGAAALLWSRMPWEGDEEWKQPAFELFVDWVTRMEVTDRVPVGFETAMERDPHEQVLQQAGFEYAGRYEFNAERRWSLETLAGFVYSTALLNLGTLGPLRDEFELDLADRLTPLSVDGSFRETASYAYELACRPASGLS